MSIHDQNPRSWHSADDPRNEQILLFLHEWTWGVKCVLIRPPVPGTEGLYASFIHKHGNVGDRVRGRTETDCAEELLRYYARRIDEALRACTGPAGTAKLWVEQVSLWLLGRLPRPMVPDKPGGFPVPAPLLDPYVADFTYVTSPPMGRLAKLRGLRAILLDFAAKIGVNLAPLPERAGDDSGGGADER